MIARTPLAHAFGLALAGFVVSSLCSCVSEPASPPAVETRPAEAAALPQAPPAWYENEIRAFEAADRVSPPAAGGVLFVGSSSIRLWEDLEHAMAPARVLNRGFGGSKTREVLAVFDRIVRPSNPSIIVYYCGDNDLGTDNTDAEAAAEGFLAFDRRARALWPTVRTFYIPIKPSIARWKNWPAMEKANGLVRAYCERTPGATYLDTVTPMLTAEGRPDPSIFKEDGLHMNAKGYERWNAVVRPEVVRAWGAVAK